MQTSLIQLDCVDMAVKYSRNEEKIQIGWENVRLVTDWLITGTGYLHRVLLLTLLTRVGSMYLLSWNRKLWIRYCILYWYYIRQCVYFY